MQQLLLDFDVLRCSWHPLLMKTLKCFARFEVFTVVLLRTRVFRLHHWMSGYCCFRECFDFR